MLLSKHCARICRNLLGRHPVCLEHIRRVISVKKLFLQAKILRLNITRSVKARDFLAESAVKYTVLNRDHNTVIRLETFKKFLVYPRDIHRIYDRRRNSAHFPDNLCRLNAHSVERAERDYRDIPSLLRHFIFIQHAEILCNRLAA